MDVVKPVPYQFNKQQVEMLQQLVNAEPGTFLIVPGIVWVKIRWGIMWREHWDIADVGKAKATQSDLVKHYWIETWSLS